MLALQNEFESSSFLFDFFGRVWDEVTILFQVFARYISVLISVGTLDRLLGVFKRLV